MRPGDTVGLIAASGPVAKPGALQKAIDAVEALGFCIKLGAHAEKVRGFLAGSDEERLSDLHAAFADDTIDGIFCLKGGYGLHRIVEQIDVNIIRANPKILAGYSDVTALHLLLNQRAGLVSLHTPMPASDFIYGAGEFTMTHFMQCVTSTQPLGQLDNPPDCPRQTLLPGKAQGVLVGGNLSLIGQSMGTPNEIDTMEKILFFEDVHEEPYRLDCVLTQLHNAGKLAGCAGVIVGDLRPPEKWETDPSLTAEQVLADFLLPLNVPVLAGFQAGHCEPTLSFPLGVEVELDASNKTVTVLEAACVE